MAAAPNPRDLAHRVFVKTGDCHPAEQRELLRTAVLKLRDLDRVWVLGVRKQNAAPVFCFDADCDRHPEAPSVVPWTAAIEWELQGYNAKRGYYPTGVRPYFAPVTSGPSMLVAYTVGWSPAIWLPEWWGYRPWHETHPPQGGRK